MFSTVVLFALRHCVQERDCSSGEKGMAGPADRFFRVELGVPEDANNVV